MNPQFVVDEVVTAAKMNQLPKGVLAYAEVTANQASISAEADLTGLTAAVTVVAGRRIRVTVKVQILQNTAASTPGIQIKEGATQLQQSRTTMAAAERNTITLSTVLAPSAGAHTYKASALTGAGTLTMEANSAGNPAFLLIEDIGGTA